MDSYGPPYEGEPSIYHPTAPITARRGNFVGMDNGKLSNSSQHNSMHQSKPRTSSFRDDFYAKITSNKGRYALFDRIAQRRFWAESASGKVVNDDVAAPHTTPARVRASGIFTAFARIAIPKRTHQNPLKSFLSFTLDLPKCPTLDLLVCNMAMEEVSASTVLRWEVVILEAGDMVPEEWLELDL